jgi:DNA polymerase I-like protein with 3'-5' exonuclease and polymerase domains
VHDEINVECPAEIAEEVKNKIQEIMKAEAQPFLKILTLESDASVSDHWIH